MKQKPNPFMMHFYRPVDHRNEICFNVEARELLSQDELRTLRWILAETFEPEKLSSIPSIIFDVVEVGPRLNYATPFNSNALSILKSCGLDKITRIEKSLRSQDNIRFDRMTEMIYPEDLESFSLNQKPQEVYEIPLIENGLDAFGMIEGSSMDDFDKKAYYNYFVVQCKRNPTIVEIMDLNNANSEHSRHGYFKGGQVINGVLMEETLMDVVKSTLSVNPRNSLVAFRDNSSVIKGYAINTIIPEQPGRMSKFGKKRPVYHFLFTAETHNFPTGVAPFPGAQTGTGGRIRDVQATGRGGLMLAGTVGYAVGNLFLDGYKLPWEKESVYPDNLASPKNILIFGSNGATRYGNEIGEPVIQGFFRAGASYLPDLTRREWLKPILFTGGIGQIDERHLEKDDALKGMLIVQIGGPAYRIGFGGGSASSLMQGENKSELDFNAVQRGDAEMQQRMNRVVRACIEMGHMNPIVSIHDQGAGGPANVLKELVEKVGGTIDIRKISSGDPTLSVLEIWVCEFQERNGLIISPYRIEEFKDICKREKVNCEILGEVTGDGIFTVIDSLNETKPVQLELEKVLGGMPQKTFYSNDVESSLKPLKLPKSITIFGALERVLKLPSVASKKFLTNKGDRSVTGLIVQQQCCGYPQLPVSDVAVVAQSHFSDQNGLYSGAAMSIGEQPIKILLNPEAGARMTVAEALTNIAGAYISDITDIKCSANWMGAPKLEGEGALMYRVAVAMRDIMIEFGIAVDGGKDSLSMATKVKHADGQMEIVKSPLELVVSAYCSMKDITKVVTPDIKYPGESIILHIDPAKNRRRLGGSALAQVYGQIGDECPDIDDPRLFLDAFNSLQVLIGRNLIQSCHDISDGGMIVSLLEMLFSGNCGFHGRVDGKIDEQIAEMFAEESGWLVEVHEQNKNFIFHFLESKKISHRVVGKTMVKKRVELVNENLEVVLDKSLNELAETWGMTSYNLEKLQCDSVCVEEEKKNSYNIAKPPFKLSFEPIPTPEWIIEEKKKPSVAIIREEGSNGDREMTSYFYQAGFEVFDVNMQDLLTGKTSLAKFRGVAFVGGFSYADVLDSAKGWAATIMCNAKLRNMFEDFYNRADTFSLSVCNGCQLASLLGWIPYVDNLASAVRFIKNKSGRFESRFSLVTIQESPAIMLKGMAGSILGIWTAHGEGQMYCDENTLHYITENSLAPIRYVDDFGDVTERYPFNPNGSHKGITGICDLSGQHLAMMPHPERAFLKWQWAYMPEQWKKELKASPWQKMVQNAYAWCMEN